MRLHKFILFIVLFPATMVLDFIVFNMVRGCATCGSFAQFVTSEGAISFPIVVGISEWVRQLIPLKK